MNAIIFSFLITSFSEAGGIFLIISPGARQVAMGSAFTGIADDATAVYYNPGGLAFCDNANTGFMNSVWLPGLMQIVYNKDVARGPAWLPGLYPEMRYSYFGGVMPLSKKDAFGFGYTYLTTGETIGIDEYGNVIGVWETYDYALTISYGRMIYKSIGAGISLKYMYSFLAPDRVLRQIFGIGGGTASAFAYDWGVLYKTPIDELSVGISCQNLGSQGLTYLEKGIADLLPSLIRRGIGFNPTPLFKKHIPDYISKLNFSIDWVSDLVGGETDKWYKDLIRGLFGIEHDSWYSGGAEITFRDMLSLRIGYFYDKKGHREGWTYGYGLSLGSLQLDITRDAAIYDFPTDDYRVQINLKSLTSQERKSLTGNNKKVNMLLAGISSLLVPGGGQFYNGEALKGVFFSTSAFALGEIYYEKGEKSKINALTVGLGTLHLISILDAVFGAND